MSDFHAHVVGLDRWLRRFAGADKIVSEELDTAGRRSGLAVEGGAKRYVAIDTAHLQRSLHSLTRTQALFSTTVVGTSVSYAKVVEYGRSPGSTPPPTAPIAAWLARKGSNANPYVVARAIGARGIPGRSYLIRAFNELKPKIRAEFGQVPKRVIARLKAGG